MPKLAGRPRLCQGQRLKMKHFRLLAFLLVLLGTSQVMGQQFPSVDENIPYLITFGRGAATSWGDDDYCQIFFFTVPKSQKDPVYIRVFDPDVGGQVDEIYGDANTKVKFTIYGGTEAFSHPDAKNSNPEGKYNSGTLLDNRTFGTDAKTDNSWYSFRAFNPTEGEYIPQFDAYIFKVIVEGASGDDGNLYRYFLSSASDKNVPIEGGNAFTYEYTFRLPDSKTICHLYPYINDEVVSIQQYNFDWDTDGTIRIVSVSRAGELIKMSGDDNWSISKHIISKAEKNTSLDFQIIKDQNVRNNNVVFKVTNQYGVAQPFYSIPIGGIPKYKGGIGVTPAD
jgi:hypothetical protein